MKSYFFQLDDPNDLSEWSTKIQRDKFNVVKEERDQLASSQAEFAGLMSTRNKENETAAADKDKMMQEISRASQINEENISQMRRILLRFGISENDMKKHDSGAKICDSIQVQIDKLRDANDRTVKDMRKRELEDRKQLDERIAQLEAAAAQVTHLTLIIHLYIIYINTLQLLILFI